MTAALWDRAVPAKETITMKKVYLWGFDWVSMKFLVHHYDGTFSLEDISSVVTDPIDEEQTTDT